MASDTSAPVRQAIEILEKIDSLRDSLWCHPGVCGDQNIETLLDDLEDSYWFAMVPWAEHRTVPGELAQEDFYRWHEYMFPPDVFEDVRRRFNELVTTSRFSVEDGPYVCDLELVNSPSAEITRRHVVSLAALVCIKYALEELESLEFAGNQTEIEPNVRAIEQARDLQKHADLWLSHLATLNIAKGEIEHDRKFDKAEKSRKATVSAKSIRKGKDLTLEVLAAYFNARKKEKWEAVRSELAEAHNLSESTVGRRYRKAKDDNLLS